VSRTQHKIFNMSLITICKQTDRQTVALPPAHTAEGLKA